MTYQALTTAITGLKAAQRQLSVISNNVSNATTPGYNRQILPQQTQLLRESGQTVGVLTSTVIRQVDMNLQRDLWTQVSATSLNSVKVDYLQQIQNFNGPPDKEFSIASKISELRDSFSALSDTPDDIQALQATLNQANIVADKFNDYADLITQLRNDTQTDLNSSVNTVNALLQEITNINIQIRSSENIGNSVAGLQDQRDIAINELSSQIDISFFERADGVLVVQTREGLELAGDVAHRMAFESVPIGANNYYPDSASGLIVENVTNSRVTRTDITERSIGGRLGGLIEMRDQTLPEYHAQLDELAFQMANRFDQQGLKLFTDQNGYVPENTPPDRTTNPPTPVPYVDFARNIQVNSKIVSDPTLLQRGTYNSDVTLPSGDNSVIRRIAEFAFGNTHYQEAVGTIDLNLAGGATDLHELLGIAPQNTVVLGLDFSSFPQIDDGVPGTNDLRDTFDSDFEDWPINDEFRISINGNDIVLALDDINTLGGFNIGDPKLVSDGTGYVANGTINNAGDQILSYINTQLSGAGADASVDFASINNYGQIVIDSVGTIEVSRFQPSPPNPPSTLLGDAMSEPAFDALGFVENTTLAQNPSITVQVGNMAPITIEITPGDEVADLIANLTWDPVNQTGVPGLFVEQNADGGLTLRPGIDDDNWTPPGPTTTEPFYGGDITITSSGFNTIATLGTTNPAIVDGLSVVSALFGNFTGSGATLVERSPTSDVPYQSEIFDTSGTFSNFRNRNLGPNAAISTGIFSADNLLDYAQKIVNDTSQDYLAAQSAFENEDTLRGIIQRQFTDESGVNIDEEMSNLIVVQTAYAAAARTITAADEMFQELLNSIRR